MTLRIFEQANEHEVIVALHGWLSAAEVTEVENVAAARGRPLTLDLSQLTRVDAVGLRVLRRLRERGVCLSGASPYMELLLERTAEAGDLEE